ncbi:hypothetical protein JNMOADIG_00054 [Aeromonas phage avDM5]|uniref:Uncharacterized protein n=1 Tax=Aeromonas phage vB_AehM_DM2 TaxID=2973716 RepID=A0AA95C4A8_9CAUD|nr:hypothetical protein JNMOADIG_00054 [Aeromonas phage avDM5]UYD60443.1 hypothetical protein NPHMPGLK_00108 [Aeromonas phage avDM2]UYD60721.1 hypothetical protein NHNEHLNL_00125 [Aeromonas phage avDM2]
MSVIPELAKTLVSYKYPDKNIFRPGQPVYFIKNGYRYSGTVIQYKFGCYRIECCDFEGLVIINPNQVERRIL